jgi:hypothetical protein
LLKWDIRFSFPVAALCPFQVSDQFTERPRERHAVWRVIAATPLGLVGRSDQTR